MDRYVVKGGKRLVGEVNLQGAKNAALPIMAATLLCKKAEIHNCPNLTDVTAARNILHYLGCETTLKKGVLTVVNSDSSVCDIPDNLMREMRSSIVFLGAIISKCKRAKIGFPGGCELGNRPIDIHLSALQKMGVKITEDHGFLDCVVEKKLKGCNLTLPFPSVGATENIILAAVMADGTTVINNAAREPEIAALANFLNSCGAKIKGAENGKIYIEGVKELHDTNYNVIPDRIVATTYLCCGAITGGEIIVNGADMEHLSSILPVFEEMGCELAYYKDKIYLKAPEKLKPVSLVRTMPYPGFPTDAQSPIMATTSIADGTSVFVENIFENRYKHVDQLIRMGADIQVEGRVAVVKGTKKLHSADVKCTDLRGGAALVVAALAADGETNVREIHHILRGYENIEKNLRDIGAKISLKKD